MASIINIKTPFQNIKIDPSLRCPGEIVLFCDDAWQLDTAVEYKYHESLITLPMVCAPAINKVLICGGGDGMALREVLRFPEVTHVDMVEIDPGMIKLFRDDEKWAKFNNLSMRNPKATVHVQDALEFAKNSKENYDLIVLDFPSPSGSNRDKNYPNLYSNNSLQIFTSRLKPQGVLSMQVSMPFLYLAGITNFLLDKRYFVWNYDVYYNSRNADSFMTACQRKLTPCRAIPTAARFANKDRAQALYTDVTSLGKEHVEHFKLFCHGEDVEYEYA